MVISYVLVQSESKQFIPMFFALSAFISENIYEECAPMATFESAMRVIQFEYESKMLIKSEIF